MESQEAEMAKQDPSLGTDHEQFPVCPHCGYIHEGEYFEMEEGTHNCSVCDKPFEMTIEREYFFTTKEVTNDNRTKTGS